MSERIFVFFGWHRGCPSVDCDPEAWFRYGCLSTKKVDSGSVAAQRIPFRVRQARVRSASPANLVVPISSRCLRLSLLLSVFCRSLAPVLSARYRIVFSPRQHRPIINRQPGFAAQSRNTRPRCLRTDGSCSATPARWNASRKRRKTVGAPPMHLARDRSLHHAAHGPRHRNLLAGITASRIPADERNRSSHPGACL